MAESEGDLVTPEWLKRHDIRIPRACGLFESATAWVRVNLRGIITDAGENRNSILDHLISTDRLEEQHGYHALVFLALKESFLRRVAHATNLIYACEVFGSNLSDGMFETLYLKVCRKMTKADEAIVDYVCSKPATPKALKRLPPEKRVHEAFETLVTAIQDARENACAKPPAEV